MGTVDAYMFKRIVHNFAHLGDSVTSMYGAGFKGYIKYIYYSILKINTFIVFSKMPDNDAGNPEGEGGLSFREMTAAELDEYRHGRNLPREFYADALGGLSHCHVVFCDSKPAYIHWVYMPGEKSRFLELSDGVAEINYILTLPEFRRRRICSWALGKGFGRLAEQGVKKVVTVVHSDNLASRRAMENAGMKEETVVKTIGPFNRRRIIK